MSYWRFICWLFFNHHSPINFSLKSFYKNFRNVCIIKLLCNIFFQRKNQVWLNLRTGWKINWHQSGFGSRRPTVCGQWRQQVWRLQHAIPFDFLQIICKKKTTHCINYCIYQVQGHQEVVVRPNVRLGWQQERGERAKNGMQTRNLLRGVGVADAKNRKRGLEKEEAAIRRQKIFSKLFPLWKWLNHIRASCFILSMVSKFIGLAECVLKTYF